MSYQAIEFNLFSEPTLQSYSSFISLFGSRFISVFASGICHIRFKRSLAQVITLVAEWIDAYGIHK